MSNIQLDIEWTEAASRKIEKLMPRKARTRKRISRCRPWNACLWKATCCSSARTARQQPFIVAERQYHHDGDADWTIILILDVPQETH